VPGPTSTLSEQSRLRARQPALFARAKVLRELRRYFEAQDFVEVETPARVLAPGQELHLDAIPAGEGRHLITSPEYHMKRLVAGGMERIVQFCRCFRAEEDGPFHQPEFTMIEWYRAGGTLDELMLDCESMVEIAARAAGTWPSVAVPAPRRSAFASLAIDLQSPFERVSVRQLLEEYANLKLRGDESSAEMRALARQAGCSVSADAAWDDVFYQIFLDCIEPHLGTTQPTFVFDWPKPLGALARSKPRDPLTVERFELYAGGIELANAFGELTDAVEQRRRFVEESEARRTRGKAVYPIDEKLLTALETMPPTSGIALGFDRLLMLVLGAAEIRDVLAFAYDEA
jgi:lysyl-tRNA synthetase class 2